jgi:hypothetical protein
MVLGPWMAINTNAVRLKKTRVSGRGIRLPRFCAQCGEQGNDVLFGVEGVETDAEAVSVGCGNDASTAKPCDVLGGPWCSRDDDLAETSCNRS